MTSSGRPKKRNTWLNIISASPKAVDRLSSGMRHSEWEKRSVITKITVFPSDSGRSMMMLMVISDQGQFGVGRGISLPTGK